MGLYTVNRYTAAQPGGGLPFYNKKEYQHRFLEKQQTNFQGYMQTPNNRLPTFQFLFDSMLSVFSVRLIPVSGTTDAPVVFTIPPTTGSFFETCLQGTTERFFFTKDIVLSNAFPSGFYYLRFQDGLKFLYSEVFQLGGTIACVAPTITTTVIANGGTGTIEIGVGALGLSGGLGVTGTPQLITPSAPGGIDWTNTINEDIVSGSFIDIRVETVTPDFGTFTNRFQVDYTNPDQVTVTPKAI